MFKNFEKYSNKITPVVAVYTCFFMPIKEITGIVRQYCMQNEEKQTAYEENCKENGKDKVIVEESACIEDTENSDQRTKEEDSITQCAVCLGILEKFTDNEFLEKVDISVL